MGPGGIGGRECVGEYTALQVNAKRNGMRPGFRIDQTIGKGCTQIEQGLFAFDMLQSIDRFLLFWGVLSLIQHEGDAI